MMYDITGYHTEVADKIRGLIADFVTGIWAAL
jgi:hypothetical protein